jgi:hypothetical protein
MENTTSLRESLEEAMGTAEEPTQTDSQQEASAAPEPSQTVSSDPEPAAAQESETAAPEGEAPREGRERDATGKFAKKEEEGVQPGPKSEPKVQREERAPQSWKPETRQHWQTLPAEVRSEIARREGEFTRVMQETAESRKLAEAFQRTVAPYEHFIKAENSNAFQAIDNLMATAARLRTGTAPELATLVSQLINQYGVGRFGKGFIETLDQALVGQAPQEDPRETMLRQKLEQEIAPVKQFMNQFQQMQQMQQEQMQSKAGNDVQSFLANHEFGMDVKDDMADLIEMAHKRGREISLDEAYEKACRSHPSIGKILANRDKASQVQSTNQVAQRARAASVSVSGAPSGGASGNSAADLRTALESAWSQAGR